MSCKKKSSTDTEMASTEQQIDNRISRNDIETLDYTEYALSRSAVNSTANWLKFQELNSYIELLKEADYSFFSEDQELLRTFVNELKTSIPDRLNETSIVARLLALETNLYKLHDEAIYNADNKNDLITAIKEVLVGYSNLVFQINKKLEKDELKIERPN